MEWSGLDIQFITPSIQSGGGGGGGGDHQNGGSVGLGNGLNNESQLWKGMIHSVLHHQYQE